MAMERERRTNAGNRLAKVLDEYEEDDFYKTTYGGFEEIENDVDYQSEEEGEDEVDSDFSIEENDEPKSDVEEDEGKSKRGKLVTKAYKEPKPAKKVERKPKIVEEKNEKKKERGQSEIIAPGDHSERKSTRQSTLVKSAETARRVKERTERGRKKTRKLKEEEHLTQEQLLEEAKITEIENLKSLEKYQKMELERKKNKCMKKNTVGESYIRYHSVAMPLVEEISSSNNENDVIKSENDDGDEKSSKDTGAKCERTFITFSKPEIFEKYFPKRDPPKPHVPNYCTITRQPAKYLDPVTQLPYANMHAFRVLREAYYQQLELKGDKSKPEIAAWLEWRQSNKQPALNRIKIDPSTLHLKTAPSTSAS
ncbi:vacuolar protein sorting-associated protein 72 homolog isoform X2 [Nilaparvata lugens]|nr:vacuolar protein sorting-associated protein 72 homolog isoform X2 [Nilaparvata lugens]XP_022200029.2 vacuolar protein sorting-associated protein 72 homolog isoform X2 [Nilaparvata lugens]XP_039286819.1 vacuolar protein sorting-associated protein 72 homolog isoform X2 [Nilaparvata lugens]